MEILPKIEDRVVPTRADIAALLATIGKPGEKQFEKQAAVRALFAERGHVGRNFQGHAVWDNLDSYGEW